MVDSIRLKHLSSKMETMLAIMEQKDEQIKSLKQAIATITSYIENQQSHDIPSPSHIHSQGTSDISMLLAQKFSMPIQFRSVRMEIPCFYGSDALNWFFK